MNVTQTESPLHIGLLACCNSLRFRAIIYLLNHFQIRSYRLYHHNDLPTGIKCSSNSVVTGLINRLNADISYFTASSFLHPFFIGKCNYWYEPCICFHLSSNLLPTSWRAKSENHRSRWYWCRQSMIML